jgi:hypothetical protein
MQSSARYLIVSASSLPSPSVCTLKWDVGSKRLDIFSEFAIDGEAHLAPGISGGRFLSTATCVELPREASTAYPGSQLRGDPVSSIRPSLPSGQGPHRGYDKDPGPPSGSTEEYRSSFGSGRRMPAPKLYNRITSFSPSIHHPPQSHNMNSSHSIHGDEKYGEEKDLGGDAFQGQTSVSEKEVTEEARLATSKEHNLTIRQGIRAYKKAIGWSILLSSAVIMEGYDTILVSHSTLRVIYSNPLTIRLALISDFPHSTILSEIKLLMESLPLRLLGKLQVSPSCPLLPTLLIV